MMTLMKHCTGYKCDKKARCYLYEEKPKNPFNYISPMDRYEECPYFAQRPNWVEHQEETNA